MSEAKEGISGLVDFLYLARERYRYKAKDAAEEVFRNFKKDGEEPKCVEVVKRCIKRKTIFEVENALWGEDDTRHYLVDFLDHYEKLCACNNKE